MYRVWTALLLLATVVVAGGVVYVLVHDDKVPDVGSSPGYTPVASSPAPTLPTTSDTGGTSVSSSTSNTTSNSTSGSTSGSTSPSRAKITIAFLGDDWTDGVGTTDKSKEFTALLGKALGVKTVVVAQDGAGYAKSGSVTGKNYVEMAKKFTDDTPDVVVVTGGRKDVSDDPETLASAAKDLFANLKSDFPSAKLVAVAPFWGDSAHPSDLDMVDSAVKAGVTAADGTYLDIADPLAGHPSWMADDANPNDLGNAAIANALEPELEKLLPAA